MSENTTVTIPDSIMEQLRCSVCNGYLSISPIRLLSNGSCICGRCSPPDNNMVIAREVAFEAVLRNVFFPCRYKQHGCADRLVFDKTYFHEVQCMYRQFVCPSSPLTACSWKGTMTQMLDHFRNKHSDLVKERAEFKLQLDQNAEGIFLVRKDDVDVIVRYLYDPKKSDVKYAVKHCANNTSGATYKLKLINDADPKLSFKQKSCNSFVLDDTFYNVQWLATLNLNKYLHCLGNPEAVVVSLILKVQCENTSLDSLKCGECPFYLTPPLFELDGNAICSDCAQADDKPLNDAKLLQLVATADYPCRWQKCNVTARADSIKMHELKCKFRRYDCFLSSCKTFALNEAIAHYKSQHKAQCVTETITFEVCFSTSCYSSKYIVNVTDDLIVLVEYCVVNFAVCVMLLTEEITGKAAGNGGNLVFEHEHCKLKSKPFTLAIKYWLRITLNSQFPACFKESDKLTATLFVQ